jgi:peptide chain release factor 2
MCGRGLFDNRKIIERMNELQVQIEDPNLWNQSNARETSIEYNQLKSEACEIDLCTKQIVDFQELLTQDLDFQMLEMLFEDVETLKNKIDQIYINLLFKEDDDKSNCFLTVHAGSGGQEAEDWARMLWEMYIKYANDHYHVRILDENYTDDGNIKSATMKISVNKRKYPYGWLKSEIGIHRLVRISPYDKKKQRHTSFASVAVTPEVSDNIDIEINEKDLRIDTYRASGAGCQHVNKTESAIRITHLPTGVIVQCQNDRSQHRNKDEAFKMLRSKLFQLKMQQLRDKQQLEQSEKKEITWGSQIRSYVQHPYQMVKDNRTQFEMPNFNKIVLEAQLDGFLLAYLRQFV